MIPVVNNKTLQIDLMNLIDTLFHIIIALSLLHFLYSQFITRV